MRKLFADTIWSWTMWRMERRLFRAFPEFKERTMARRAARKAHGKTAHIDRAQKAAMTALLRQSAR